MSEISNLSGVFALLVGSAAFGGFIDFIIGAKGQKRIYDRLETWWIRFDDVRWTNFGREEAEYAVRLMDLWFGRRLLSYRRVIFVVLFIATAMIAGHALAILYFASGWFFLSANLTLATYLLIAAVGLATSLSVTRLIAVLAARSCRNSVWKNFTIFTMLLGFTYLIMVNWLPVWDTLRQTAIFHLTDIFIDHKGIGFNVEKTQPLEPTSTPIRPSAPVLPPPAPASPSPPKTHQSLTDTSKQQFQSSGPDNHVYEFSFDSLPNWLPMEFVQLSSWLFSYDRGEVAYYFAGFLAGYFAYVLRLLLAFVFVGSFLVRPVMRSLSHLWLRTLETGKPVFTMIFTGLSALGAIVQELGQHL